MSRVYHEVEIPRPLYEIAGDIEEDWDSITPEASEWLEAMATMTSITEPYYTGTGRFVVSKFLATSQGWRGDTATDIKDELRKLVR